MPLQASHKQVLSIAAGQSFSFFVDHERKTGLQADLKNLDGSTDFVVTFYSAPSGTNEIQQGLFAGPPGSTSTFTLTVPGLGTTAAITYSSTAATLKSRIQTALDNLCAAPTLTQNVYPANTIRVVCPDGTTANLYFSSIYGGLGKRDLALVTAGNWVTGNGTSPSLTFSATTDGALPGGSAYTAQAPDGRAASTSITVKPFGEVGVAFGTRNASNETGSNLLGPYIKVTCTSGNGQVVLSHSDPIMGIVSI